MVELGWNERWELRREVGCKHVLTMLGGGRLWKWWDWNCWACVRVELEMSARYTLDIGEKRLCVVLGGRL